MKICLSFDLPLSFAFRAAMVVCWANIPILLLMVVSLVVIVICLEIAICLFFLGVVIVICLSCVLTLDGIYMHDVLGPKALEDHP